MVRKLTSKKVATIVFFAALAVCAWGLMYLKHLEEIAPSKIFQSALRPSEIEPTYKKYIEPIVTKKCGACHTATSERPFFYYIPLLSSWSKSYVDAEIDEARGKFDLEKGLAVERLGSTMERILSLRGVMQDKSMPPTAYHSLRPYQKVNEEERKTIVAWANQALASLNEETFKGVAVDPSQEELTIEQFGEQLSLALASASPLAGKGDAIAHKKAMQKIGENEFLKTRMNSPFLWGGQNKDKNYDTKDQHLNRFNPLVWRKFYLSLFMFDGDYEIFPVEETVAYVFPVKFRSELADGLYPYPFWHSPDKWRKYNEARTLIFLAKNNKIVVAMRSAAKQDLIPKYAQRKWNGKFRWFDAGDYQPVVNNYASLFSPDNPHTEELDRVYRSLALGFRAENCTLCHTPANSSDMKMLEFLSSPAHTLAAKDRLPIILRDNVMPPVSGVNNHNSKTTLVELADEFQLKANMALAFEREILSDSMARPLVVNKSDFEAN